MTTTITKSDLEQLLSTLPTYSAADDCERVRLPESISLGALIEMALVFPDLLGRVLVQYNGDEEDGKEIRRRIPAVDGAFTESLPSEAVMMVASWSRRNAMLEIVASMKR